MGSMSNKNEERADAIAKAIAEAVKGLGLDAFATSADCGAAVMISIRNGAAVAESVIVIPGVKQ